MILFLIIWAIVSAYYVLYHAFDSVQSSIHDEAIAMILCFSDIQKALKMWTRKFLQSQFLPSQY